MWQLFSIWFIMWIISIIKLNQKLENPHNSVYEEFTYNYAKTFPYSSKFLLITQMTMIDFLSSSQFDWGSLNYTRCHEPPLNAFETYWLRLNHYRLLRICNQNHSLYSWSLPWLYHLFENKTASVFMLWQLSSVKLIWEFFTLSGNG